MLCYMLYVICYMLYVICYMLYVICCMLLRHRFAVLLLNPGHGLNCDVDKTSVLTRWA